MPVRDKAVSTILHVLMGDTPYHFNNVHMTATVNGKKMSRDKFDEIYMDPIERIYERVVDSIDWNRVMLEASARHIALGHDEGEDRDSFPHTEDICPKCLCEALLTDDTHSDWKSNPDAPRFHSEVRR